MKKVILSGIQPSGNLHIGNYIGALSQWVGMQEAYESLFCLVDLHAITVPQPPKVLRAKNLELAALYIACGIDPAKSHIFIQSENPDHSYLAWILNCITPFGQLERMTQFKDKSAKQAEGTTVGLFDYPVLMAADILLYDTDEVPVGEDQKQHIELTRDIAEKFNRTFGDTFKLPNAHIMKETARIMSLQNPLSKMSKSDANQNGTINLLDTPDVIVSKIKKAVTNSGSMVDKESLMNADLKEENRAIENLIAIYAACANKNYQDSVTELHGKSYGEFKNVVAEAVVTRLTEIQKRYGELRANDDEINKILDAGVAFAKEKSSKKVKQVVDAVGLGRSR